MNKFSLNAIYVKTCFFQLQQTLSSLILWVWMAYNVSKTIIYILAAKSSLTFIFRFTAGCAFTRNIKFSSICNLQTLNFWCLRRVENEIFRFHSTTASSCTTWPNTTYVKSLLTFYRVVIRTTRVEQTCFRNRRILSLVDSKVPWYIPSMVFIVVGFYKQLTLIYKNHIIKFTKVSIHSYSYGNHFNDVI